MPTTDREYLESAYAAGSTTLKSPVPNKHFSHLSSQNVHSSLLQSALLDTEKAWTTNSATSKTYHFQKPAGVPNIAE